MRSAPWQFRFLLPDMGGETDAQALHAQIPRWIAALEVECSLLEILTRPQEERAALIGRLHQRADGEWLAELLIDLEEDEPARLYLMAALRRVG